MKLAIYDSEDELATRGAEVAARLVAERPDAVLALPAGRTAIALYRTLVAMTRARRLDWSRVRTFNLDEFVGVSGDAPGSFRRFTHDHLLSHVNVDPAKAECPNGAAPDLDAECARYDAAIAAAGGLDLAILGLGANGHIAFNEPAPSLAGPTHRVVLAEASRIANKGWFDGDPARVPREALTMGMGTILKAREILMIAAGDEKADAAAAMFHGGISTAVPASLLQVHRHATVILDRAAAAKLDRARTEETPGYTT